MQNKPSPFRKHIALPSDHGSWVFLISPLLIGLFAGGGSFPTTYLLIFAVFAAFFIRQPTVIAIKVIAGRRSKKELSSALFWIFVYGSIAIISLIPILNSDYAFILNLAIPGVTIFILYLWFVYTRTERNRKYFDILASGSLALAAPATYWSGVGHPHTIGWILWSLVWAQSAASILYAFLRLSQRKLKQIPDTKEKIKIAGPALIFTAFNFFITFILSYLKIFPPYIFIAFLLQFVETIYGTLYPAINKKPREIGIRQLIVSTFFTIIFIISIY